MLLRLAIGVLTVTALTGIEADAQNYPWCANFADGAGTNCGFTTYEQCMTTSMGSGGTCTQNNLYRPAATATPLRRRRVSAVRPKIPHGGPDSGRPETTKILVCSAPSPAVRLSAERLQFTRAGGVYIPRLHKPGGRL